MKDSGCWMWQKWEFLRRKWCHISRMTVISRCISDEFQCLQETFISYYLYLSREKCQYNVMLHTTRKKTIATAAVTTYLKQNFLLEFSWSLAITFRLELPVEVSKLRFKVSPIWRRSPGISPWQSRWCLWWKLGWTTWRSSWCWHCRHIAHNLLLKQTET